MNMNIESKDIDRHTFLPPANVVLPDAVGKLISFDFVCF